MYLYSFHSARIFRLKIFYNWSYPDIIYTRLCLQGAGGFLQQILGRELRYTPDGLPDHHKAMQKPTGQTTVQIEIHI